MKEKNTFSIKINGVTFEMFQNGRSLYPFRIRCCYHPQTKFAKVMFLHMSVCPQQEGWYPSMHCRSPGPHPGGRLRGLAWGGGLQAHTQGKLRGLALGVSRSTPRGEVEGSGLGGSPDPHLGGVSRPTPRGLQVYTRGVCIPACTEADTPWQTATAVGGLHPAGMHSCFHVKLLGIE